MENYIEQLKPLFAQVADKIGQGTSFGWEVVLRQQIAYGIIAIFVAILGLAGIIGLIIWHKKDEDLMDDTGGGILLIWVLTLILFIAGTISAILYLTNPEYYALQFFINLVK